MSLQLVAHEKLEVHCEMCDYRTKSLVKMDKHYTLIHQCSAPDDIRNWVSSNIRKCRLPIQRKGKCFFDSLTKYLPLIHVKHIRCHWYWVTHASSTMDNSKFDALDFTDWVHHSSKFTRVKNSVLSDGFGVVFLCFRVVQIFRSLRQNHMWCVWKDSSS